MDEQVCAYCGGEPALIVEAGGAWCTEECQRNDRQSEVSWWRRWSSRDTGAPVSYGVPFTAEWGD
jgi:hypothetical protein